jgi:hypothetical protein
MNTEKSNRKFELGRVEITEGASSTLAECHVWNALNRHANGDWGNLCDEYRELNDWAVYRNARLMSRYCTDDGTCFWIITEWDRSVTTILLPEEF